MGCQVTFLPSKRFFSLFSLKFAGFFAQKFSIYNSLPLKMASAWIPIDEVTQRVLEENANKVFSSFSDESEREISDNHVSDSSNEEIAVGNGITLDWRF